MNTKRKRVLLVEDSREMQAVIRNAIGSICLLSAVGSGEEGQRELEKESYSLLLLDVSLPDTDGFEFCRRLRKDPRFADLPVTFITGKSDISNKVQGFEAGADDYITKPFEPEELRARVQGKLRRLKSTDTSFAMAGLRVDFAAHKVFSLNSDGTETTLPLTPIEFKLLSHFMKHEGQIFPRQKLLDMFWGDSLHVSKHTVDTHISSLRKKMGKAGAMLRSIFKQGYTFVLPKETATSQEHQSS